MATRDCAIEAIQAAITPWSRNWHPAWAMAWRLRSAAWIHRHRDTLQDAILRAGHDRVDTTSH